jgi:hypothetical protein
LQQRTELWQRVADIFHAEHDVSVDDICELLLLFLREAVAIDFFDLGCRNGDGEGRKPFLTCMLTIGSKCSVRNSN